MLRRLRPLLGLVLLALLLACPTGHGVVLQWLTGGGYGSAVVYRVYRQQDDGAIAVAAVVQQAAPTWTDSNVASGHRYAYWVTAYDPAAQIESQPSNTWTVALP